MHTGPDIHSPKYMNIKTLKHKNTRHNTHAPVLHLVLYHTAIAVV